MSLLPTPTFSGAGVNDTFYVKIGGGGGGGGITSITSVDNSLVVSGTTTVNLTTTGTAQFPLSVVADQEVSAASFIVPTSQSLSLNDPITKTILTQPIYSFGAPTVFVVPAAAASSAIVVPDLDAYLVQPGFHILAYAINLPYVAPVANNAAAGLCGFITLNNYGNSGGGQAPVASSTAGVFSTAGMAIAFTGTGGAGTSPYVATITNPGGATTAGTIAIMQLV
jgi:hypothetical protein